MDQPDQWREHAIRDAVLAGDRAAWRIWYDEHFARLEAFVQWRCKGLPDLVEDVLQDTWLTAVNRLKSFDPSRGPFAAWLVGIAANAIRNALRTKRRDRSRPLATEPEVPNSADEREKAERVARTLAALNPLYEAVLRAKYLDRQSVDQIAESLGDTAKAVESRLTRARQAFREQYEADHD